MADKGTGPTGLHDLLEEALPLMAEDLRVARVGLGLTSTVAAERAELDTALYCALEEGSVASTTDNVGLMMSASRCLGMEAVRFSYLHELQQYMKVDLSTDGPLVVFVDTLSLDIRELKEEEMFVSPSRVLALLRRLGFDRILKSRQPADKQLIELWTAAVFTLCLGHDRDYYVRLVRDDPPDTEVLEINGADRNLRGIGIEVTQHGSHSRDLVNVIGKKLRKKYQKGTELVVLAERAENILVNNLDEYIRANNPYNQRVYVVGGSDAPNTFKVVPLDKVSRPTASETEWLEIDVNAENASRGHRGYEGVVLKPPGSRFLPPHPTFVKELELHR